MKPVWLMIVLLAACRDRGVAPHRVASADSADQVLDSMTFDVTRDGVKSSRVQAESAWVYQLRQVADLKNMTVTSYDSTGATISTITADRGVYAMRDKNLDARGHVIAHSSGGRVLKTEHLVYDRIRNLITSDTAFTSTSPKANLSGAWFEADPGFKNVRVTSPKGRGKQGFVIPGQTPGARQ
ncbi:MAG: LPS export ABC transporter periplasmic protein LptC [Gemmatimonadales bacterium]